MNIIQSALYSSDSLSVRAGLAGRRDGRESIDVMRVTCMDPSMPRPPEAARLRPSRVFPRSPPFLNGLTRSTLPTSSLSPQLPVTRVYNFPPEPIRHSPGIILTQSYPSCSSLDSLRSIHTSSLQSFPTTPSWQSWFQQKAPSPPPTPNELDKLCSLLSLSHTIGLTLINRSFPL